MAWYHDYDGGRAFYTELGHTEASYTDSLYLEHILGGIQYAIGDNKELNYTRQKASLLLMKTGLLKLSYKEFYMNLRK